MKSKCIGVVSPASVLSDDAFGKAVQFLEGIGFSVKIFGLADEAIGRFAGTDVQRADAIMDAFNDPHTDIVLCARGGHGSARSSRYLDIDAIKRSSKPFFGYSDVTYLLSFLRRHGCRNLFHGPMLTDFAKAVPDVVVESFLNAVSGNLDLTLSSEVGIRAKTTGAGRGYTFGGNLAVLSSTVGTAASFHPEEGVLFFEDVRAFPFHAGSYPHDVKKLRAS